jgi:hypothetical protein
MANDLNQKRGDRPQNQRNNSVRKKTKTNMIDKSLNKSTMHVARAAEKASISINDNIFPGLTPEEHRLALIESCVNTDNIFTDHIDDPPEKASEDFKDYMFYSQLYFLAASQMMQPDETGSILPGIVGGLSMIAGAALMSDDFRKNMKQHVEDKLVKYVEPFKDSAPKLWQ